MSDKNTESLTEAEAKRRAKKYMAEFRKKYPMGSIHEDEPTGLLAGNPDNLALYEELSEYEDLSPAELRARFKLYQSASSPEKNDSDDELS